MSDQVDLGEFEEKEGTDSEGHNDREWKWTPLSELIEPVLGKTPKRSEDEYWEGGEIKWASASDISQLDTRHIHKTEDKMTESGKEESNAKIMPEGTVVVTARGTLGEAAQLGEPMTFNQSCYALKTEEDLLDDYLYYAWQYVFGQVQAVSYGTVFDTITMKSFKDIEIPHPPIEIQKPISEVLSAFDDKIETNLRIDNILEKIVREEFNARFIDFEPYDEFVDSEVGEIPDGFEVKSLTDVSNVTYGYGFNSDNFNEDGEGTPVIRNGDLPNETIDYSTDKYMTKEFDSKYKVRPGDLIVTMDRYFDPYIWKGETAALNQRICKFEGCSDKFSNMFLYCLIHEPLNKIERAKTGTTLPHLGKSDIDNIDVIIPDDTSLEDFNKMSNIIQKETIELAKENRHLAELRDTLRPRLMSGEVQIDPDNNDNPESTD